MKAFACLAALVLSALVGVGCSSIDITSPANGSTVAMPAPINVTTSGNVSFGTVTLDGAVMSQATQVVPQSILNFVPPGTHTLAVGATDSKIHTSLSKSSSFTVSTCPLCYTGCPASTTLHPVTGQCCTSTMCDQSAFTNFGIYLVSNPKCQAQSFPGGPTLDTLDCISTGKLEIKGANLGTFLAAVSFSPNAAGALSQIQVPLESAAGTSTVTMWVTADASNAPGAVLETIPVTGVRPLGTTSVNAPIHVFSVAHPALTAGTRYWLVIGPGAADTGVMWNLALDDVSTPGNTTLLSSATNSPAGPWAALGPTQQVRPAFEIDVR